MLTCFRKEETMRIIFATGNEGKMREIRMIMADLGLEILSMKEAGLFADVDENGATFEENAVIKAKGIAALCDDIVLADDSGLEIDALNKEPGVYSARYMGEDTSYHIKNANLVERLNGVPDEERTARFVCAIAAVLPDGRVLETREKQLRAELDMKNVEKTDLVMIRFLCFHSMECLQQKFLRS